ncbi:hypothetical protein [Oceanobacillus iheyensis HTE831]|uniref:N-acetyltransferase domain-containing protein n=1 Tax=Oceanobacillus iheyensis (strain DSM 14371 / CIP 107618 / JCM 11309 / KCTC 3954 / HTE831) TaxID=221109 RepID=Q8ERZ9_OCEIH|nr:GNAT family N-acetyltransferase [Oceanobacillus iheyensis]BAC12802.1 hypothetical protein [Oceanobacillus iheyensis HTE831]
MKEYIRELTTTDLPLLKSMDTGIIDDYVIQVFERLSTDQNRIYGLFVDEQLVSIAGYSIFAHQYVMLGRLRSDRRYRGKNYATKIMKYIRDIAFQLPNITWVGGNTQENNLAARRVLTNIGLIEQEKLYPAITEEIDMFIQENKRWHLIEKSNDKANLLKDTYIHDKRVFPFECYYPFPATNSLFTHSNIDNWNVYETHQHDYPLVTKKDVKKDILLHVIFPFSDVFTQSGLWETVYDDYYKLKSIHPDQKVYIWLDIPEYHIHHLPPNHPFSIDSPWILHGMSIDNWNQLNKHSLLEYNHKT